MGTWGQGRQHTSARGHLAPADVRTSGFPLPEARLGSVVMSASHAAARVGLGSRRCQQGTPSSVEEVAHSLKQRLAFDGAGDSRAEEKHARHEQEEVPRSGLLYLAVTRVRLAQSEEAERVSVGLTEAGPQESWHALHGGQANGEGIELCPRGSRNARRCRSRVLRLVRDGSARGRCKAVGSGTLLNPKQSEARAACVQLGRDSGARGRRKPCSTVVNRWLRRGARVTRKAGAGLDSSDTNNYKHNDALSRQRQCMTVCSVLAAFESATPRSGAFFRGM